VADKPPRAGPGRTSLRRPRAALALLVGCLVVFVLVAGWLRFYAPRSAPAGVTMTDLHGVADLRARFNADRGQPRLIVVFSPT